MATISSVQIGTSWTNISSGLSNGTTYTFQNPTETLIDYYIGGSSAPTTEHDNQYIKPFAIVEVSFDSTEPIWMRCQISCFIRIAES